MLPKSAIFQKTYRDYLTQIDALNFQGKEEILGILTHEQDIVIPFLGDHFSVSHQGIKDGAGREPDFGTCVILCKYLLLCPDHVPATHGWVNYRDFKDAGPLTVYFQNEVERPIASCYAGRVRELETACLNLGGSSPDMDLSCDLMMRFVTLPKVPLLMLYNDQDDPFPAQCTLLFQRGADAYLDPECLAMVGAILTARLTAPSV